jgi:predicted transcriptional regulator YheO
MQRKLIVFGAALSISAGLALAAVELDTDLMQNIDDTNKSLASNIALKDAKAAIADAKSMNTMFDTVETYFVQKGDAANAVDLTKKSRELTLAIVDAVTSNDYDAATNVATTLSRTCKTCHTFYKKE